MVPLFFFKKKVFFRMSNSEEVDYSWGRAKHLGQLALIFYHRNGTWRDFARFLDYLFSGQTLRVFLGYMGEEGDIGDPGAGAAPPHIDIACRHNSGGRNHDVLIASGTDRNKYPMFNHERYTRKCFGIGAYDESKNPGLVVAAVCTKAKEFLLGIGKGDIHGKAGRDFTYRSSQESQPSSLEPPGSSMVSDTSSFMDDTHPLNATLPAGEIMEDLFGDEDAEILEDMEAEVARLDVRLSISTISGLGGSSAVSILQDDGRTSSTKMRAATLAYLWQFSNDIGKLKAEFRRLRRDRTLEVLHLCGCGICYKRTNTGDVVVRYWGCVERSHLKLGSSVENGQHKSYHMILGFARPEDYAEQCQIIHRFDNGTGDGIF
jgi:hypothetical protein